MSSSGVRTGGVNAILTATQGAQAELGSAASGAWHAHGYSKHVPDLSAVWCCSTPACIQCCATYAGLPNLYYGLLQQGAGPVVSVAHKDIFM